MVVIVALPFLTCPVAATALAAAPSPHDTSSSAREVKGEEERVEGLTIGAVARRAGLRPSAIRFYESAGLLPAPTRVNGRRRYDAGIFDRLAAIRLAQAAGFTVAETRAFLHGFAPDAPPPDRWRALAGRKLPEVAAQIARLGAMQTILEAGLRCECPTLADCARALDAPPCPTGDGAAGTT
jgi:MerR family transcriptional regulator, redox-sensitive transcriptional activator SoxR